jgi:hypothetical protein
VFEILVKTRIDEDDLAEVLDGARLAPEIRQLLEKEFANPKEAKDALTKFKQSLPTGGDDSFIIDELKEIAKDLKWATTKRGKLVIQCNERVPELYETIRDAWGESDVMVGAHTEELAVIVAGKLKQSGNRERIVDLVKSSLDYPVIDRLSQ